MPSTPCRPSNSGQSPIRWPDPSRSARIALSRTKRASPISSSTSSPDSVLGISFATRIRNAARGPRAGESLPPTSTRRSSSRRAWGTGFARPRQAPSAPSSRSRSIKNAKNADNTLRRWLTVRGLRRGEGDGLPERSSTTTCSLTATNTAPSFAPTLNASTYSPITRVDNRLQLQAPRRQPAKEVLDALPVGPHRGRRTIAQHQLAQERLELQVAHPLPASAALLSPNTNIARPTLSPGSDVNSRDKASTRRRRSSRWPTDPAPRSSPSRRAAT